MDVLQLLLFHSAWVDQRYVSLAYVKHKGEWFYTAGFVPEYFK